MQLVGLGVLMVLTLACSVGALVSAARHRPPALDAGTTRRVSRTLNRGTLPSQEPDRSAAVVLARHRARSIWPLLASAGLGGLMLYLALASTGWLALLSLVPVAIALLAATVDAFMVVTGRRALAQVACA